MKFKCRSCVREGISEDVCTFKIKNTKSIDWERDNWREALRRCPFENDTGGKFNGEVPMAEWEKVKKK
jgi:hypothetical protein